MPRRRPRTLVLRLGVLAVAGALGSCASPRVTWPYPLAFPNPAPVIPESMTWSDAFYPSDVGGGSGDDGWYVVRVVDHATVLPIAGAEVHLVSEDEQPLGGRFWSDRSATTDPDGFARMRVDDLDVGSWTWVICFAPGWSPSAVKGLSGTIELREGVAVPIEIRDFAGRPVLGVDLAWVVGCGHTPDVQYTHTAADGRATMWTVAPEDGIADLYAIHDALAGGYESVPWRTGQGVFCVFWPPGRVLEGTVVDGSGRPLAGLAVGIRTAFHRGCWSRTDAQGRFLLRGVTHDAWVIEVRRDGLELDSFVHPFLDREARLVLRETKAPSPPASVELRIRMTQGQDGPPAAAVPITARFPVDGDWRAEKATTDANGIAIIPVPRAELVVEARPAGPGFEPLRVAFGPESIPDQKIVFNLRARPRFHVRLEAFDRDPPVDRNPKITLYLSGGEEIDVTAQVLEGEPVPVPPEGEFAFGVSAESGSDVHFRVESAATAGDPMVLRWPEPHVVKGRIVAPDGRPLAGAVEWFEREFSGEASTVNVGDSGALLILTGAPRGVDLTFRPREGTGFRLRAITVPLPPRDRPATIDLGDVVLPAIDAPILRVLLADGSPAASAAEVRVSRPGREILPSGRDQDGRPSLSPDGGWDGLDLQEGDVVIVSPPPPDEEEFSGMTDDERLISLPLRARLEGHGPWVLRFPSGEISLRCVDDHGAAVNADVVFPGLIEPITTAAARIRNVPAGRHRLLAYAAGHRTCIAEISLAAGEQRALTLVLPRL